MLPESLRSAKGLASFALITRRQRDNAIDRRAIVHSNRFNLSVSIELEKEREGANKLPKSVLIKLNNICTFLIGIY